MDPNTKEAAPGRGGNQENHSAVDTSLTQLAAFLSPVDAERLPHGERDAYFHGFSAGVHATTNSAYNQGVTDGRYSAAQDAADAAYQRGWNDALQAHRDALDAAARDAVRPHVQAVPYWELCLRRGQLDKAQSVLRRALQTGLAGPGDTQRFHELAGVEVEA